MPHDKLNINQFAAMRGKPVYALDGDKLGNLDVIYYDEATGEPEWLGVKSGLLGMKHFLVPVMGAQFQDGENACIRVPYPKEQVSNTPDVEDMDEDGISEEAERRLYLHYGLQPSERRSESVLPEGQMRGEQFPGREGEVSVSRHEEELHIGRRQVERGRVRLRKWVETQPVSEQVELRRETAHLEREPVDRPAPGAQLGEQEVEVTLHEERPVVEKETVERERVRVRPEEETVRETVQGEVRREQVEVEGEVEEERK
jgi:stress response protein YsnF